MKPKKQQEVKEEIKEDNDDEDKLNISCFSLKTNDEYQYFLWSNVLFAMNNLHFDCFFDEGEEGDEEEEDDDDNIMPKYLFHLDLIKTLFVSEKMMKAAAKLITLETLEELADACDPDPVAFSEEEVLEFVVEVLHSVSKMFSETKGSEEIVIDLKEPEENDDKTNNNLLGNKSSKGGSPPKNPSNLN